MKYEGQCHCGKIRASFETQKTPAELGVRTCQCTFCRRQGAVNISDPQGRIIFDASPIDLIRYRFGLRTADFLICRHCGVYFAAVMGEDDKICSTLNVAALRMKAFFDIEEAPADYDVETVEERIERRYQKWTPTTFADPELAALNYGPHLDGN